AAPPTPIRNAADFFHIDVHHLPRPARRDGARRSVGLTTRVDESAPIQTEPSQVPGDGAHRDRDVLAGQLVSDTGSRPFTTPPQLLDPPDRLGAGCGRLPVRDTRPIM